MVKTILIAAFILCHTAAVYSQDDSTRYIFGLPVSDDDTVEQFLERDLEPKENLQAVPVSKLPSEVHEALVKEEQYRGWQDSTIYFDKNTRLFMVHVKTGASIRIYGLDENGNPVTFSEVNRTGED